MICVIFCLRFVFILKREEEERKDEEEIEKMKENSKKLRSLSAILHVQDRQAVDVVVGGAWIELNEIGGVDASRCSGFGGNFDGDQEESSSDLDAIDSPEQTMRNSQYSHSYFIDR